MHGLMNVKKKRVVRKFLPLKFAQIEIKPQTTFNLHFLKHVMEKRSEIYN